MRLGWILSIVFVLFACLSLRSEESHENALMILNMKNEALLPRNFRTTKDPFKLEESISLPAREGLDHLNISGSSQFSEKALKTIIQRLGHPSHLYIIDLRQESHGFINGTAISWYAPKDWGNINKTLPEIEKSEKESLENLLKQKTVTVYRIVKKDPGGDQLPKEVDPTLFNVSKISTEKEIVFHHQLHYLRLPVTDHIRPTDDIVDEFIAFVKTLPPNSWIHFHCAAGIGRTTTFMAMYDMIINAKKVSFEDIIKRQWLIGGVNLQKISDKYPWRYPYALERFNFLKEFYDYCQSNTNNFQQSWTAYLRTLKQEAA